MDKRSADSAGLMVKLTKTGTEPLSITQVIVFDLHRLHRYGEVNGLDLRVGVGDSRTVAVSISPLQTVPYLRPPSGDGMIEALTATGAFNSEGFRFSDLFAEPSVQTLPTPAKRQEAAPLG